MDEENLYRLRLKSHGDEEEDEVSNKNVFVYDDKAIDELMEEERYYEDERNRYIDNWIPPFSEEVTCSLDPFCEIKSIRSSLNRSILRIERYFPHIQCRNLQSIDAFFNLKKTTLKARENLMNIQDDSQKIELTVEQKDFLRILPIIEDDIKEIGDLMRHLHTLLLKEGLLVKRVRRRPSFNKRRKLLEQSTNTEDFKEVSSSTYLDLNVSLPSRPLMDISVFHERQRRKDSERHEMESEEESTLEREARMELSFDMFDDHLFYTDDSIYKEKFGSSF